MYVYTVHSSDKDSTNRDFNPDGIPHPAFQRLKTAQGYVQDQADLAHAGPLDWEHEPAYSRAAACDDDFYEAWTTEHDTPRGTVGWVIYKVELHA